MIHSLGYIRKSNRLVWLAALAILVFANFRATAQTPDSLLKIPYPQRYHVLVNLYGTAWSSDSVKAQGLVSELRQLFKQKGTDTDQLILETALFGADQGIPSQVGNFPGRANKLLEEAAKQENLFVLAKVNERLGMFYFNQQRQYALAFRYYLKAYEIVLKLDEAAYPGRDYTIYLIARAYYDFLDYENAIKFGGVLVDKSQKMTGALIFNADMVAMAHLRLKHYAEARQLFEWALRNVEPVFASDPTHRVEKWTAILSGNIGLTYFEEKNYDRAIPYLNRGIELGTTYKLWNSVPEYYGTLAQIALDRRQLGEAERYARLSLTLAKQHKDLYLPSAKFLVGPYQVISATCRARGLFKQSLLYADSAAVQAAIVKQQLDISLKHKAELAIEQERLVAHEQALQQERDRQILIRNTLLLLALLTLLITLLLYNRQRLKHRHRQQQLQAERQLAEAELQSAVVQLDQFRQAVQQKSQLIDQFETKLESLADNRHADTSQYQLLNDLRHSVILTEDDWNSFVELFEKAHPGFFVRLKEKMADLTPAETRYMALSRLGYSTREMAAMLGVGTGAIRQYRLNLRRKLALPEEHTLEQLALQI